MWTVLDRKLKVVITTFDEYNKAIELVDKLNEDNKDWTRFTCTSRKDVIGIITQITN